MVCFLLGPRASSFSGSYYLGYSHTRDVDVLVSGAIYLV